MGRRSDPHWRDAAVAELAAEALSRPGPLREALRPSTESPGTAGPPSLVGGDAPGPMDDEDAKILLVDDPRSELVAAAAGVGGSVRRWNRSDATTPGTAGASWPSRPSAPFDVALVRLPRSKDALRFSLAAAADVVRPGGMVAVYGAKDEGAGSAEGLLADLLDDVGTLATGGRCRVVAGRRPETLAAHTALEDWRRVELVELGWGPLEWASYPGTFARGGVDPGSALLARHLPELKPDDRVLDFAAGTGVLAACARHACPELHLFMVEPDALARRAAAENVPGARTLPLAEWVAAGPFHVILSNPPYHLGKAEDTSVVARLIQDARSALASGGELRMVVQRRLPVEGPLREAFPGPPTSWAVEVVADEGPYRVWSAKKG